MTNRELDTAVAMNIMGWKVFAGIGGVPDYESPGGEYQLRPPHYSTDLNEAFRVIEKMREKFRQYMSVGIQGDDLDVQFHAEIDHGGLYVVDESPARAICLCALRVIDEINKLKETK